MSNYIKNKLTKDSEMLSSHKHLVKKSKPTQKFIHSQAGPLFILASRIQESSK